MIQEVYGAYVAASVDEKLLFGQAQRAVRFSHETVNHVVRVQIKSGHRPVRGNAVNVRTLARTRAGARNIELNELPVLIAYEPVIHISLVNIPARDRSIG